MADIAQGMIRSYSGKNGRTLTSLTENVAKIIIFIVGSLLILHSLDISITPILATLGMGGLAVALALQDTLANFFAGFYIIFAKQVKVGDYVKLNSGEEGYVTDINWRITKVRRLSNNTILIPNDKLIKTIVTNYHLPEKELAVLIEVGVDYESDLEKVERTTVSVAKEIMSEVKGGVPGFEPFIRYHTFGEYSINFSVIIRGQEFVDQYLIKHEFIKRLHKHFQRENIIIPFPIRTVRYQSLKGKGDLHG